MNLNDKTSSFGLIRTNPKISGNVKITTDSQGLIWLNSFDATKELSASEFKKFRIGTSSSSYESDLKKFFGKLPPEIVFAAKENKPDPKNISNTFQDQYDFFYNMGAENLISKFYDEDYSYLAPLWLRDDLPENFVIFRVDEPLDFPYNKNVPSGELVAGRQYILKGTDDFTIKYSTNTFVNNNQTFTPDLLNGNTYVVISGSGSVVFLDENKDLPINTIEQFKSIVKRAQIIKTFDLSENSNIGKYIRNIVNNKFFPSSPITARFDQGLMTTWNGASYKEGIMTSKGELLDDFWSKGQLQIDFEEYITKGFERHGIICPYLLNLEFLFDDDTTPTYSIPRYFGFYVSKIELAKFQLDGQTLYNNRATSGNTPAPKRANKGFRHQAESFFQNNPDGVRLFYMNEIQANPSVPLFIPNTTTFTDNFDSRFYWIQDKNGNFYSFDQTGDNTYNTVPTLKDIVVRNKSVDLGAFAGPGRVKLQDKGRLLADKGRSYMVIRVNTEMFPNDTIQLFWNLGYYVDSPDVNGPYHILTANDLSKRPFTVAAGGTVLTVVGMDLTSQYNNIGEKIQLNYGSGNSVERTLAAPAIYAFGNTTITINAPIDLVTTSGTTPIVPGWGPGSALISENNDTIYYHPYGTFNEIARSIAAAFNLIENKTFDAVAIDDKVVIRMRQGESIPNQFFVMANLTLTNELFFQQEQAYVPGQKYFFEGGTDTNRIRLRFPWPAADILKDGEVFLKTKRGLSKIIFVGRYVDEAIQEVGGSEIGDLDGFREFGACYIEDNLDEPSITTSGDFIAYTLYNIPVGLFSIFNVKEIDGDFFSSTYSRSPLTEVHRYFDILADTPKVLVPGRKYIVKSEDATDSISYLGNTITASLNGTVFTAGLTPSELGAIGDGVNTNFSFNLLYAPAEVGTVTVTAGLEIFTDNGDGTLTSNLTGTGTVDYETGSITISCFFPVPNLTPINVSYNSLSGFTVTSGSPVVVAHIFHAAHVLPTPFVVTLDPTHTYVVYGDPTEYVIDSASNIISASFNGSFSLTPGSTWYQPGVGNPLVIDINKFVLDGDLKSFSGFWTFKGLIDVNDNTDTSTIEFNNREKFIHHNIDLEYDFLKENFSKQEAVKSRIFPIISKWVYSGGDDIRNNPYRLNTHPVFGAMNFSPSSIIKVQDPQGFSHEWPYLEQPPQQYPEGLFKDNYYFFYDRIDLSKIKDANPSNSDYFREYFTFQPAENTPDQERYDIFRFNSEIGLCEAFFRGVKIRIKEVIRDTQIEQIQGIKPPFKDQSTRYEGYKFSVLLRPLKQDRDKIQAPVTFNLIENKTHKTILFVIDLVIEDYRSLTLINPANIGSYGSPVVQYPDLLDSHVDYLLLYSVKSKKSEKTSNDSSSIFVQGLDGHDIGDIKLSVGIDASSPSGLIGGFTVINVFDNPDYDWDLRDEFKNFNKENILTGSFVFGDTLFPYPLSVNQTQIFFGLTGNLYPQDPFNPYPNFEAPISNNIFIPYGSDFDWEGFPWTQVGGGNLYFEPIMQRLSFGKIAEKINSYSPFIKYNTYYWDESTLTNKVNSNEFYIEVIDPSKITKVEAVLPQIDEDKPEEFKNESTIGVDFIKVSYFNELYRYSGPYEPKFRNVLFFKDQKSDVIVDESISLSFMQATLNPAVEGFGYLKNLGYLKVAKQDVLTLANNPKYDPKYPLLNEVPVDKRDFYTFQSNWDPGFWRIYTTKKDFFPQAGTREMEEIKNFFGTKIMKTHDSVRLQDWLIEPQIASLDQINIDNFNGEIVYAVVGGKIQALINVKKRLLRFLIADGANTEFVKYLMPEFGIGDPDTIDDDVLEYLTLNVLPTYEVKLVDLYIKSYKENLNLSLLRGDMTDAQKLQNGYLLDKNFTTQKKSDFVYYFEYVLDDSFNVSLAPSLTIGKI